MDLIYERLPYYDELYHHGIKGMKWGIRRYQNEDGSLTAAGKKRYGLDTVYLKQKPAPASSASSQKSPFDQNIKAGKDKPPISTAEKVGKDVGNMVNNSRTALEATNRIKTGGDKRPDYSDLSDAELKQRIARLNLEKQYSDLTKNDTYSGYQKAMDILSATGAVVGIASGAVGIVSTIYKFKHG